MMASTSQLLGGIVLICVGLYQWTPLKSACLAQCQSPLFFIQQHGGFRRDVRGSLKLGLRQVLIVSVAAGRLWRCSSSVG
jgi:predicted metal-binding membrane protein